MKRISRNFMVDGESAPRVPVWSERRRPYLRLHRRDKSPGG